MTYDFLWAPLVSKYSHLRVQILVNHPHWLKMGELCNKLECCPLVTEANYLTFFWPCSNPQCSLPSALFHCLSYNFQSPVACCKCSDYPACFPIAWCDFQFLQSANPETLATSTVWITLF